MILLIITYGYALKVKVGSPLRLLLRLERRELFALNYICFIYATLDENICIVYAYIRHVNERVNYRNTNSFSFQK